MIVADKVGHENIENVVVERDGAAEARHQVEDNYYTDQWTAVSLPNDTEPLDVDLGLDLG